MARVAGVELNDKWKVGYALTNIKGVGWSRSAEVMAALKIDEKKRISDLSSDQLAKVAKQLDKYTIEGDLLRQTKSNVSRLRTSGTYRGKRHSQSLPARGQRTKSNARAKRGKRKTVGSFRKEALSKMQTN